MNNLPLKFGLVDAKIRASDKDLPVRVESIIPQNLGGSLLMKLSQSNFNLQSSDFNLVLGYLILITTVNSIAR